MKNAICPYPDHVIVWIPAIGGELLACRIDEADLAKVSAFPNTWRAQWDARSKTHYVTDIQRRKATLLHRLVMDAPAGLEVDHQDHDGLNNRRSNLRLVSRSQNALNRRGARSGSRSGVRGVYWHKLMRQWRATVRLADGRRHEIGGWSTVEAAKAARDAYLSRTEANHAN